MIEINEDVLCEYCNSVKSFPKLSVGDIVYIFCIDDFPHVEELKVKGIKEGGDGRSLNKGKEITIDFVVNIGSYEAYFDADYKPTSQGGKLYLYKKDANKRLEEYCIGQIIKLSKIIGGLSD